MTWIDQLAPPGGRLRWPQLVPGLALWLPLAIGAGLHRPGPLLDSDGYMHVVRLWEVVAQGGWAGGWLGRDGAPGGMVLHWTMPYDLLVLALAAPLAPFAGWHEAIRMAAPWGGPATGMLLVVAVGWAAAPGGRPAATVLAAMLAATPPVVISYGALGRDDHHLLILTAWVAVGGALWRLLARPSLGRGVLLGTLSALAGWIALESLPPALGAALAVAVLAAQGPRWRRAALGFAAGFPAVTALALMLDPPASMAAIDRLSPAFLAAAGLSGLVVAVPLAGAGLAGTIAAAGAAGAAGAALFLAVGVDPFPDPAVGRLFWAGIAEFRVPTWPGDGLTTLGPGIVGLLVAVALARGERRLAWALLALAQAALLVAAARHARLGLYPCTLGAMATAAGLARLFRVDAPGMGARLLRACALAAAAVWPLPLGAALGGPAPPPPRCAVREAAAIIERERLGAIVFADPNLAPPLLYWGETLRTVAGPYHGDGPGLVDHHRAASTADEAEMARIIAGRRADFVLACGRPEASDPEPRRSLLSGNPPAWLRPLPLSGADAADLRLYHIEAR